MGDVAIIIEIQYCVYISLEEDCAPIEQSVLQMQIISASEGENTNFLSLKQESRTINPPWEGIKRMKRKQIAYR